MRKRLNVRLWYPSVSYQMKKKQFPSQGNDVLYNDVLSNGVLPNIACVAFISSHNIGF